MVDFGLGQNLASHRRLVQNYNDSKLALLIDPSPLPHLVPLMLHMMAVVPPDWRFLFIGSQWSIYMVARAPSIQHHLDLGRLQLMQLPEPWAISTDEDRSRLLTDARFYSEFLPGVEWLLNTIAFCVQTLASASTTGLAGTGPVLDGKLQAPLVPLFNATSVNLGSKLPGRLSSCSASNRA